MTNVIDDALNKLCSELNSQKVVQDYFKLKELIKSDSNLMKINEEMRKHQKLMVEAINDPLVHKQEKELYENYKNSYENNPLIISYNNSKDEVYSLLKNISNIVND